jgi:hypothetical protein
MLHKLVSARTRAYIAALGTFRQFRKGRKVGDYIALQKAIGVVSDYQYNLPLPESILKFRTLHDINPLKDFVNPDGSVEDELYKEILTAMAFFEPSRFL